MIHDLLLETCALIKEKMNQELEISVKTSHRDLVTNVDQEIEVFLSRRLRAAYPHIKILGEETDKEINLHQGEVWIIDPIDGTSNFIKQRRNFGILLAKTVDGEAIDGYICDVINETIYHGSKGKGVTKDKQPFKKTYDSSLKKSLVALSDGFLLRHVSKPFELIRDCLGTRYTGACSIDGIAVLEGWLGAYGIRISSPWDIAPHLLFADELGLVCLNLDGTKRTIDQDSPFFFGQKEIVEALLMYCSGE